MSCSSGGRASRFHWRSSISRSPVAAGLEVFGVSFPGHFLLRVPNDAGDETGPDHPRPVRRRPPARRPCLPRASAPARRRGRGVRSHSPRLVHVAPDPRADAEQPEADVRRAALVPACARRHRVLLTVGSAIRIRPSRPRAHRVSPRRLPCGPARSRTLSSAAYVAGRRPRRAEPRGGTCEDSSRTSRGLN